MNSTEINHYQSYPIFIMYEQLNLKNAFADVQIGLDVIWERCIEEYNRFRESYYSNQIKSEYDCIVDYVKATY